MQSFEQINPPYTSAVHSLPAVEPVSVLWIINLSDAEETHRNRPDQGEDLMRVVVASFSGMTLDEFILKHNYGGCIAGKVASLYGKAHDAPNSLNKLSTPVQSIPITQ